MLIDSHVHLNFPDYGDNLGSVIAGAKEAGVEKIVNIGTSLRDSKEATDLAGRYEGMFATVGFHPNDNISLTVENTDWEEFERLAKLPKVVAIGECGLDYSRIAYQVSSMEYHAETDRQKKLFTKQIEIARRLNLPLSIHIRDAQEDVMNTFEADLIQMAGVFHCFSGNETYLNFILGKLPGFYVSFAGNVTFKNAGQLQELARKVPLERLLVETDCPFLSPEPLRGKQNVPANVKMTAQKLADVNGLSLDEVSQVTSTNAATLFGFAQSS